MCACEAEDTAVHYPAPQPISRIGKALVGKTTQIASLFKDSTYTLHSGVTVTELAYLDWTGKPMRTFNFEIDLNDPAVTIANVTPDDKPIGMGSATLTRMLETVDSPGNRVLGGTNTDFGSEANKAPQSVFWHEGICYKNNFTAYHNRPRSFFYLSKNKVAGTGTEAEYSDIIAQIEIREAFGGSSEFVRGGQPMNIAEPDLSGINPRTMVGVSQDGKTVYLVVVDGRRYTWSNGMQFPEMRDYMIAIGSWSAINADGGGSSTFAVRAPEGAPARFTVRNWPNDAGGIERQLFNGLAIIATD